MREQDLPARVVSEIQQVRLIDGKSVVEWRHHFLGNACPVYALDYARHVRAIQDALSAIDNLDAFGRGGLFFYSSLTDRMRLAREYVKEMRWRVTDPAVGPRARIPS